MSQITTDLETVTHNTKSLSLKAVSSDIDTVNKKIQFTKEQVERIKEILRTKHFTKTYDGVSVEADLIANKIIPTEKEKASAKYPEWLPTWDPFDKYESYKLFDWKDKGLKADPNYKNLFPNGVKDYTKRLTPNFGTEVTGIQLSQLTDEAKNDLAKYVAERGVLVFRNQDLAEKGPEFALKLGEYFGPQHIHPTSGAPASTSKIHLIYRPEEINNENAGFLFRNKNNITSFHSDISFESQPPAITFLALLEGPETGGDTVFVDTVQAYKRLSPEFQEILKRLKARHRDTNVTLVAKDELDLGRRVSNTVVHPIVRTIASTGEKALYVNPGFTKEIEGLKEEESKAILDFLFNHLHTSVDLHLRASWEPGTVVVWDNRRTEHSALFDWFSNDRRHLFRITPLSEVPYL